MKQAENKYNLSQCPQSETPHKSMHISLLMVMDVQQLEFEKIQYGFEDFPFFGLGVRLRLCIAIQGMGLL